MNELYDLRKRMQTQRGGTLLLKRKIRIAVVGMQYFEGFI